MTYSSKKLEQQARCEHTVLNKERIRGQRTGEFICQSCSETFISRDDVEPVESRDSDFILSIHALRVAIKVNGGLKLAQKYNRKIGSCNQVYDYALIDDKDSFVVAVASDIAEQAIKENIISITT